MQYQFQIDITVQGVPRRAGDVVSAEDIPAGHLENLLRMSQVKPYTPPVSVPAVIHPQPLDPVPEPVKPTSGKRRKG